MNTYEKGDLYRKKSLLLIKTKLCSDVENIGIIIEIAQKHKPTSASYSLSDFWTNDYQILLLGNEQHMFFFTKEKLINIASVLEMKISQKNRNVYIHLPFDKALRYATLYIKKDTLYDISHIVSKAQKLINETPRHQQRCIKVLDESY